jgi:predicted transcriptional regulator
MKKLIVSLKTSTTVLNDFKTALKESKKESKNENSKEHYEISFDNKREFNMFIRNIDVLSFIIHNEPKSIYELAKLMNKDVSNLNKIILFYEKNGVIKLIKSKEGRSITTPKVKYDKIEFNLAA